MELEPATAGVRGLMGIARLGWSRWLGRLSALALASPVVLALVEIVAHPWSREAWLPVWHAALLGGIGASIALALAGAVTGAVRLAGEGSLRVEGEDVVMETASGVRRTKAASIASGVVFPGPNGARVELELASGDRLFADVGDVAQAERVLAALGLDAGKRRCTIALESRALGVVKRAALVTTAIFVMLGVLGSTLHGAPLTTAAVLVWLTATTAASSLAVRVTRRPEVSVGADGVLVRGRIGTRFIPFGELGSVRAGKGSIELVLRSGRVTTVPLPGGAGSEAALALALRVQEAIRAQGGAPDAQARLDLLARGGRSLEDWRHALGQLLERASGYREAGLSPDDLAAILLDPASSGEHRMGAALALAATRDPEHHGRLRIAADACASEPMRIALGKLAEGELDEGAVEEALAGSQGEATTQADVPGASG